MLILGRADLEAVLEPRALIDALERGFADYAAGRSRVPPRSSVPVTDDGILLLMPAVDDVAVGTKIVTFYAGNQARGVPTIYGTYILMDGATGRPLALLDGTFLTGLRTAAASALAARFMARKDSRTLVCFGAGVQAGFQLLCLTAELPIEHLAVIGRDPARARRFAMEWSARLGKPVAIATDGDAAVATADVVTCATTATTPLFDGRRLRPGTHVDAVGGFLPTVREVDAEGVRRARVVVDQPGTIDNAGELAIPIKAGVITREHVVGDLAAVVSGAVAGRTRPDEITLFKSEGFALEDLVAARLAYARATERGLGRTVDL